MLAVIRFGLMHLFLRSRLFIFFGRCRGFANLLRLCSRAHSSDSFGRSAESTICQCARDRSALLSSSFGFMIVSDHDRRCCSTTNKTACVITEVEHHPGYIVYVVLVARKLLASSSRSSPKTRLFLVVFAIAR